MSQVQAKQIQKVFAGPTFINGFTVALAGTSVDVTAPITTALATAGNGGNSVPLQVSTATGNPAGEEQFTSGVITTGNNLVSVKDADNQAIDDGAGNEVYGRITEAAATYTLSFFSAPAGVETPFNLPAQDINFDFNYRFEFEDAPADIAIAARAVIVNDDPSQNGGRKIMEITPVTALNTIGGGLGFTPIASTVQLEVNGVTEDELAGGAFSVAGTAITWSAVNAGYNLQTTDRVVAIYQTLA